MIDIYRSVAKHGVKVTIDGHGADELLSGYDGFLKALDDCLLDPSYSKHILKCFGHKQPSLRDVIRQLEVNHHGKKGLLKFLVAKLRGCYRENLRCGKLGRFNSELYSCFTEGILPTLLRNYDRYSMASGVEIRMPFMDHRLVSFCFSLPWQSKIPRSNAFTKALLRDAIGPWIPDKVRYRRSKIGFSTPVSNWFQGPWKQFVLDTVDSQEFRECSLIDGGAVRDQAYLAVNGSLPSHEVDRTWSQMMPFLWHKSFLQRAAAPV